MSVTGKPLPSEKTLLGTVDVAARQTANHAKEALGPIVSRETPHKSGQTATALRPRIGKTATGVSISVAPPRGRRHGNVSIAQVVRWVTRGTGVNRSVGGPGRRIRSNSRPPRPMILPGGKSYWTVAGQKPNPFMGRIEALGTLRVQSAFQRGATDAARAVEKALR